MCSSLVLMSLVSTSSRTTANRTGTSMLVMPAPAGPRITRPCMPTFSDTVPGAAPTRHSRAVVPMVTW